MPPTAHPEPLGKIVLQSVPTRALLAGAYRCRLHVRGLRTNGRRWWPPAVEP